MDNTSGTRFISGQLERVVLRSGTRILFFFSSEFFNIWRLVL